MRSGKAEEEAEERERERESHRKPACVIDLTYHQSASIWHHPPFVPSQQTKMDDDLSLTEEVAEESKEEEEKIIWTQNLDPKTVRDSLKTTVFKNSPVYVAHELLKAWWKANENSSRVIRYDNGKNNHGIGISWMGINAFHDFMKERKGKTITPKHLQFLKVYLDDMVTPHCHMLRKKPKSVQIKHIYFKTKMNGNVKKWKSNSKKKKQQQQQVDDDEQVTTTAHGPLHQQRQHQSQVAANANANTNEEEETLLAVEANKRKMKRNEDRRKSRQICNIRDKDHKVICFGCKMLLCDKVDYQKTNAGPTDYIRMKAMEDGYCYGCGVASATSSDCDGGDMIIRYKVYSCSNDGIKHNPNSIGLNLERHWICDWNRGKINPNFCPYIDDGPFEYAILDYYYNTGSTYFDKYYSKSFITDMIPFAFSELKVQTFLLPNYDKPIHDYTIQKFINCYKHKEHQRRGRCPSSRNKNKRCYNVRIIIIADDEEDSSQITTTTGGGDGDPVQEVVLGFSEYFYNQDKGEESIYELKLKRVTASKNPLWVATNHDDIDFQLKNRKGNPRTNSNMMENEKFFHPKFPFVSVTCKKKVMSSSSSDGSRLDKKLSSTVPPPAAAAATASTIAVAVPNTNIDNTTAIHRVSPNDNATPVSPQVETAAPATPPPFTNMTRPPVYNTAARPCGGGFPPSAQPIPWAGYPPPPPPPGQIIPWMSGYHHSPFLAAQVPQVPWTGCLRPPPQATKSKGAYSDIMDAIRRGEGNNKSTGQKK